jgi:hypothetical protein
LPGVVGSALIHISVVVSAHVKPRPGSCHATPRRAGRRVWQHARGAQHSYNARSAPAGRCLRRHAHMRHNSVPVAALPSAGPSSCTPARSGPGRGRSYNERTLPPSVGGALLFRINAPDRTCVDRRTRPRHDTEPDASVTQRDDAWAPILFFVLHDKDNSTARGLPVSVRWLGLSWCATRI